VLDHVGFFSPSLKVGFEMKKDVQLEKNLREESSSAGSVRLRSFCNNRPLWIFPRGIGLAILFAVLMLESGCTFMVESTPSDSVQQTSTDIGPVQEYQPSPPEVIIVYQSDLNPYGSWVDVAGYGQCWAPYNRPTGWEPYTVGYWTDTDYGWTWVAVDDESQWGNVTYHYGRWYSAPSVGWVWIPGTTWAPAWVAWREGGGYCGWAPLPPQAGFGVQFSTAVADRYVPANQYVYCDERYATAGRVDQHIVRNDVTIINQTTNITNITYANNHIINRGMSSESVARATGHPVKQVTLATATTPGEARGLAAAGKPVIYSPPIVQEAESQRSTKAKTSAGKPEYVAPSETPPQPPVKSPHDAAGGHSGQNPTNTDNGPADTKDQKPVNGDQAAAGKAKAAQDQSDAKAKAAADAKTKAAADAKAKAIADAKAKAAVDAKAKAAAAKKPADKPSDGQ
jgi:hypothetical protein